MKGLKRQRGRADDEATKRNAGKMVAFIEALMAEDIEEAMKHDIWKDTTFIDEDGVKWELF